MNCGGGVLFEDTNNVADLSDGVTIEEINVHDRRKSPLKIVFDASCTNALCAQLPHHPYPDLDEFDVVNNHIVFAAVDQQLLTNPILSPFLRLPLEEGTLGAVLGLYGEIVTPVITGRIVLTGPDNNYHGSDCQDDTDDPYCSAKHNQYELLFQEIDWLLELE
jgi:hypothetical protein